MNKDVRRAFKVPVAVDENFLLLFAGLFCQVADREIPHALELLLHLRTYTGMFILRCPSNELSILLRTCVSYFCTVTV